MILTIDPGNDTGWSLWRNGKLVACGLGDPRTCPKCIVTADPDVDVIDTVWVESQMVYPHSPVPANDIVTLARGAGEWCGIYRTLGVAVDYVLPNTWKGGPVPKKISHPRIEGAMTPADQSVFDASMSRVAKGKRHNVLDAIGIGQWAKARK